MQKHDCGGVLTPVELTITEVMAGYEVRFPVPGLRCTKCSEEVISADEAHKLEIKADLLRSLLEGQLESTELSGERLHSSKARTTGPMKWISADNMVCPRTSLYATTALGAAG